MAILGPSLGRLTPVVLLVVLGAGCYTPEGAGVPEPRDVTLTASRNLWTTLPVIALKHGFFEEEGLDVSLEHVQAATFSMDALVAGSTDFAAVVEVNVTYLGFTENRDLLVLSTIVESRDGAIVARRDTGISTPADLKGKTLGVLKGTTSEFFAEGLLRKYSLSAESVSIQNLAPVAMQASIATGAIDAASAWHPFIYNIETELLENAIVFSDPEVYTGYMNIATTPSYAQENPSVVRSFLAALRKAETFVREHPAEAQATMAREINLELEVVTAIWSDYTFELGLDVPVLLEAIDRQAQWIRQTQESFDGQSIPSYEQYFDPSYLERMSEE